MADRWRARAVARFRETRFGGRSKVDPDMGRTDADRPHLGGIVRWAGASRRVTAGPTLRAKFADSVSPAHRLTQSPTAGSRGSDPRPLGLTMGGRLDRTSGERPRASRIAILHKVRPTAWRYVSLLRCKRLNSGPGVSIELVVGPSAMAGPKTTQRQCRPSPDHSLPPR